MTEKKNSGWITRIVDRVNRSLRYKLLTLALAPMLLVMPVALVIAVYWGTNFTYDQLYVKVNTDLSVARDVFRRQQQGYLDRLARLAESYRFRTDLEKGDVAALEREMVGLAEVAGFTYLHLVGPDGRWLYEQREGQARSSVQLIRALQGQPTAGVEIFSADDLAMEGLAAQVKLPLIVTPHAKPTNRAVEDRGMMVRALYPVRNAAGRVVAVMDGGLLLNGNFGFVDAIRDLVYGQGSLPEGSIGTVTVFIDDVRISTNVPLQAGERALGTRVSQEVRDKVLGNGEIWLDRAFVVNDWYISAYEAILDVNGYRVGMLYAGYLEAPYRNTLWQAFGSLVLLFLGLMGIYALLAVKGAKSVFKPVEAMARVVKATRAGEDRRIGNMPSQDEIGDLAREFDMMLELLMRQHRQIQGAADVLEHKVEERTAELKQKNADLQRTIDLLQRTREQLVIAEKLAALGELTAGVAHEINNPTAVIMGNLDVIRAVLGKGAEPVAEEIRLIDEQLYRIRDIVNNLLQYARPADFAGYLSQVDVNEVVQSTLKLVSHLTRQSVVRLETHCEATRVISISMQELQQVLVNLLVNALHAVEHQPDAQVLIKTGDWSDRGVWINVQDNGCGIAADVADKVFNPFYSTKDQGEGTGLGLSVSYGLIRRYGGTVTLDSREGEGATFTVWLLAEPDAVEDDAALLHQLIHVELEPDQQAPG